MPQQAKHPPHDPEDLSPAEMAKLMTLFQSAHNGARHLQEQSAERMRTEGWENYYSLWLASSDLVESLQAVMKKLQGTSGA